MKENEDESTKASNIRKFPILLGFAASAVFILSNVFGNIAIVFRNLGEFIYAASIFLFLFAFINELKYEFDRFAALFNKIILRFSVFRNALMIKFSSVFKINKDNSYQAEKVIKPETEINIPAVSAVSETLEEASDGLVELHKDILPKHDQTNKKTAKDKYEIVLSFLYIASFLGILLWQAIKIFRIIPLSYSMNYRGNIADALLLLVFPCTASIYLNLGKEKGSCHGDKTSHDILILLSLISIIYASFTAASVVLNINILGILKWVYVCVIVYLLVSLSVNIFISILKKNILGDFNYTLIPKIKKENNISGIFDSEEVKRNFSIKSLYTVKYTLRILPGLILSLGFILLLSTAVFVVQPHQGAAVYRFGRLDRSSIVGQGLHFKLPWPVDIADIYDIHRLNSLQIGYESSGDSMDFLWTVAHDGGENLLLLGNGNEVAAVNLKIVYYISDLYSYITTSANPQAVLSAAAYVLLMNRTVSTTFDAFLSIDRDLLSSSILDELSEFCKNENLGLSVVQIIIESIHPPVEAAETYQRVVTASVEKNAIITAALAGADRILIDAQRQSKVAVDNSIAEQYNRVSAAQKEMAVYYAAMEAYQINPRSFRLIKYLNTFETVISGNKVFVFSPGTEGGISNSIIGKAGVRLYE